MIDSSLFLRPYILEVNNHLVAKGRQYPVDGLRAPQKAILHSGDLGFAHTRQDPYLLLSHSS